MMQTETETRAWLKLALVPGLKMPEILTLLKRMESPEAIWDAGYGTLVKAAGEETARRIRSAKVDDALENTERWLSETPNSGFLTIADENYPTLMIEAGVAPLVLFTRGNQSLLRRPSLTTAGSARPDAEGKENAEAFGEALARRSVTLSAGLFPGVETQFIEGAVLRAGKPAILWGATGPDRIWPQENRALLTAALAAGGLLVTPFAPGSGISERAVGLQAAYRMAASMALLVIRASSRSHALKLAKQAADWGRDVFAVPGSIHAPQSKGCHRLIRDGAKLVESADEIVEEFMH